MSAHLPDKRLRAVVCQSVHSILAAETPVITAMSRSVSRVEADCWAAAKRVYRFLENERFNHHLLYKGLYRMAQRTVEQEAPGYVVVAIDPVNFEKPYTQKLEGVSTVLLPATWNAWSKSTMIAWIAGKPNTSRAWWTAFLWFVCVYLIIDIWLRQF